ncbi:MAG: Hpt domain-containing protein [Robiginitalea sp.]|jgi:HPt (histidine-containing phosphotransfer) domain-containing protein|nr:MAG: Hpt domain-containing protein [Flavobacteriaceae bacterium]
MIYNLNKIREMADGDEEFVQSVIAVFLEEVPEDLDGLETAVGSGDYLQIYKLSHKIKPNVDLMGMEGTRALALEMETMGKNEENLDGIRERFPRFKKDVEQVISELKNDFGV